MKNFFSTLLLMLLAVVPALAQEIVIDEISMEEGAYMVNKDCMTVRFKLNNNTGFDIAAGEYEVAVNVGGKIAGEPAATKAIENGSYESFVVHATPHVAGENLPVEIVVKGWGGAAALVNNVNVAAEVPSGEKAIGISNTAADMDYYVPLNTYYDYSQTEIVYTAEDLDLTPGTVMTGFSFKGFREDERLVPVKVWIEQTEDLVPASTDQMTMYSTENMTLVYNDNYQFRNAGSNYEHVTVFSVDFPEPVVYAGNSLRIIVQTEKATLAKKTTVEVDKSKSGHVATRYADGSIDKMEAKAFKNNSYGTPYYMPVLYLNIEKEASTVSGTVNLFTRNDMEVGSPLAGAEVCFQSGNVMYFATTDNEGKYSVQVCQDKLNYYVQVNSEDVLLFPNLDELQMQGTSTEFDINVVQAFGAMILDSQIPGHGYVNHEVTIKANVANFESYAITPENAEIVLYKGDLDEADADELEVLAKAEDFYIEPLDTDDVVLTFTAHEAWDGVVSLTVLVNGEATGFDSSEFSVYPEEATEDYTMAYGMETSYTTNAPVRIYSNHSYSQTVITEDMLQGLTAGTRISGLKLESAQSANTKSFAIDLKAWIMNTTDGIEAEAIDPYSADLKQVYEGTFTQYQHGHVGDTPDQFENFIEITFSEPFIYEGGNIRIAMEANNPDGWVQTYFKAVKGVRGSFQKSSDNPKDANGNPCDIKDYTWASSKEQTPVFTFVLDNATWVSGSVVDADTYQPIADAVITLTADEEDLDVFYAGQTDAEGAFSLCVVQNSLDYTVTIEAEGYATLTLPLAGGFDTCSLGEIQLIKEVPTGIDTLEHKQAPAKAYDLMGRELKQTKQGIYVIGGDLRINK